MKKYSFLLLFLFLVSANPFFFDSNYGTSFVSVQGTPQNMGASAPVSLKTSSTSNNEWEYIDTFSQHPDALWSETESGFSSIIENGLLNLSDVGDGSSDYYYIDRDLRDTSGDIEIRFRVDSNESSTHGNDRMQINLMGSSVSSAEVRFYLNNPSYYSGYWGTTLYYYYGSGQFLSKIFTGTDRVMDDTWYILKIRYNLYKSELRYRLLFDNGSQVWDVNYYDVTNYDTQVPLIFTDVGTKLRMYTNVYTATQFIQYQFDYVKAPFKENEWDHTTEGGDTDWLMKDSWDRVHFQDDIDQAQIWGLNVINLDQVSGVLRIHVDDNTAFTNGDELKTQFFLYNYFIENGSWQTIAYVSLELQYDGANTEYDFYYWVYNSARRSNSPVNFATNDTYLSFTFALFENRQKFKSRIQIGYDNTDETAIIEDQADADFSGIADQLSNYYAIAVAYYADLDGNTEGVMSLEQFQLVTNAWWEDLAQLILVGPIGFFVSRVTQEADNIVIALLNGLIEEIAKFIGQAFDAVMEYFPEEFRLWTDNLLIDIATLWDGLWSVFGEWIDDIWTEMSNWIDNVWDAFLTHVVSTASDTVDWLVGLIFEGWNDETGPNILAAIEKVWSQFTSGVNDIPAGLDDLKGYIDFWANWFAILLTGIALGYPMLAYIVSREPATYVKEFIDLQVKNVLPIGIFGWHVHIPFCLVWFPLFLFELGWSA